jgi:hypothetical protein
MATSSNNNVMGAATYTHVTKFGTQRAMALREFLPACCVAIDQVIVMRGQYTIMTAVAELE